MRRCFTDPHYWKNPALRRSREKKVNLWYIHGNEWDFTRIVQDERGWEIRTEWRVKREKHPKIGGKNIAIFDCRRVRMEPFQMILFLFHMFHMCFLVSTVITMTCWSMNPCYDVIITSIPGTSQQYGDGDALEILEFHRWAKDDPNQARPAVTRCDHDGVSCGLSQFHCVECLALLPNTKSLPLKRL